MPSFTTINKVDPDGFIAKYDVYETREEADSRVAELRLMRGYKDAFVVDNDATAMNGEMCFQSPKHFPVDVIGKKVAFSQKAFDATLAESALNEWRDAMIASDQMVSRGEEDLFDSMDATQRDRVNASTKNKIVAKKALRATRPA